MQELQLVLVAVISEELRGEAGKELVKHAATSGHVEAVRLLLQAGVDKNCCCKDCPVLSREWGNGLWGRLLGII